MSCNADCKCRKGIVALVFVPGIMGTRLMNKRVATQYGILLPGKVQWSQQYSHGAEGRT